MDRRTFVTTAGATVASVALAGCSNESSGGGAGTADGTGVAGDGATATDSADIDFQLEDVSAEVGDKPEPLQIVESRIAETSQGAAVIGTVRNTADFAYEYVEIEVTLNDGDTLINEWVDTSEEELDSLAAGETWRFVASFEDENVSQATNYTINLDAAPADGASVTPSGTETTRGRT